MPILSDLPFYIKTTVDDIGPRCPGRVCFIDKVWSYDTSKNAKQSFSCKPVASETGRSCHCNHIVYPLPNHLEYFHIKLPTRICCYEVVNVNTNPPEIWASWYIDSIYINTDTKLSFESLETLLNNFLKAKSYTSNYNGNDYSHKGVITRKQLEELYTIWLEKAGSQESIESQQFDNKWKRQLETEQHSNTLIVNKMQKTIIDLRTKLSKLITENRLKESFIIKKESNESDYVLYQKYESLERTNELLKSELASQRKLLDKYEEYNKKYIGDLLRQ